MSLDTVSILDGSTDPVERVRGWTWNCLTRHGGGSSPRAERG